MSTVGHSKKLIKVFAALVWGLLPSCYGETAQSNSSNQSAQPNASDQSGPGPQCEIQPRIDAVQSAVDEFKATAEELKTQLAVACAGLLSEPLTDPTSVSDEALEALCEEARLVVDAQVDAGLALSFAPATCQIAPEEQAACEATCQDDPNCEEASLEARCAGNTEVSSGALLCTGELTPPACAGDTTCFAACDSVAKLQAECFVSPVTAAGGADADVIMTIVQHFPSLLAAEARAELMVDSLGAIVTALEELPDSPSEVADCGLDEDELTDQVTEAVNSAVPILTLLNPFFSHEAG